MVERSVTLEWVGVSGVVDLRDVFRERGEGDMERGREGLDLCGRDGRDLAAGT